MKPTLKIAMMALLIAMTGTSCKKNWECTVTNQFGASYTAEFTAKKRKDAKLECQALADGKTYDLKAK